MSILRGLIAILFWTAPITLACDQAPKRCGYESGPPMCATFTKSFYSECHMKSELCRLAREGFHLVKHERTWEDNGCCESSVSTTFKPVCGSDGKTYRNKELMDKDACRRSTFLTEADPWTCNDSPPSEFDPWFGYPPYPEYPRPTNRYCSMPISLKYNPVCGSDGKMHFNKEALDVDACSAGVQLTLADPRTCSEFPAYFFPYEYFQGVHLDPTTVAGANQGRRCRTGGMRMVDPICGSDGHTHTNRDFLRNRACWTGIQITEVDPSHCPDWAEVA